MNRAPIFIDTWTWIALLNADDKFHSIAKQQLQNLNQQKAPLVTSEFVLLEVADGLASPRARQATYAFIQRLRGLSFLEIVGYDEAIVAEAWQLYATRHDKAWGITDCISFVIMGAKGISSAFTGDVHFRQAGFVTLI